MIIELKITFTDPGAPSAYLYFEKTADWSPELVQQFFEQNRTVFGEGAEKIEESKTYTTREEAEADVKDRFIDHWNGKDMCLWPPNIIGPAVLPVPAEGVARDPLPAEEVRTVSAPEASLPPYAWPDPPKKTMTKEEAIAAGVDAKA